MSMKAASSSGRSGWARRNLMSSSSATGAGVGRLRYVVVGLALGVLLLATVEVRTAYVRDAVLEHV